MRAIIYDKKDGWWRNTHDGFLGGGNFHYYKHDIPVLKTFLGEETIPCDAEKIGVGDHGARIAEYDFDGKDYIQRDLRDKKAPQEHKTSSMTDYTESVTKAIMIKDIALEKPTSLKEVITWLAIIVVALLCVMAIMSFNGMKDSWNGFVKPYNTTINMCANAVYNNINNTKDLKNMYNQTYHYMLVHNP